MQPRRETRGKAKHGRLILLVRNESGNSGQSILAHPLFDFISSLIRINDVMEESLVKERNVFINQLKQFE